MKVIYDVGKIKKVIRKAVLAIGIFDGMHLGHQKLIARCCAQARKIKGKSVVLTFHPHPVQVLRPEIYLPYIVSVPYRLQLIEQMGVDLCVLQEFTKKFSKLTPKEFIENYLLKFIYPAEIIVGEDFRFGNNRLGDLTVFKELGKRQGIKVSAVSALRGASKKIGSTSIRREIAKGNLMQARKLLGRPVSIVGTVVKGEQRGKSLGFPTANILPNGEVLPPLGVYAVKIRYHNEIFKGMANLGRRPTFRSKANVVNIEVHVFDFDRNIYDKDITVEFIKKIRHERAFFTRAALIKQLKKDELKAKAFLK